ncbi:MAG: hypothetical protein DRJ61_02100 [Acidobacteria bacterium]|nr:MAG: hypothetical protein DRJ61_02100 [Acidobacteriota bacterium]
MDQDLGVTQPADDLIPLFLSEALDRLDHLDEILGKTAPAQDSEDWRSARRELHTLKGASRMMGLIEIAQACHQAEDAFEIPGELDFEDLLKLVQRIRNMVGSVIPGELAESDGEQSVRSPKVMTTEPSPGTRVPRKVLDRVSDQAARLSFLARGANKMVEDLYGIARTAESGVSDPHPEQVLATLAIRLRHLALRADRERSRLDRLVERQLGNLLSIQVQPVRPLLSSLGRHAEELGASLGKTVHVHVEATRCRLDRRIMDALKEALLHLVRNAVDHGIEPELERKHLGKSPAGTLSLRAETLAERVRLTVSDDGRGVDPQTVLERAVDRGLVTAAIADNMPDEAVRQLLFQPGFSTRTRASSISGRGIGLDSVADAVRKVGGEVWIDSTVGEGASVTLDLPVTRRGESILVVGAGGFQVGIPTHQVQFFSGPRATRHGIVEGEKNQEIAALCVHLGSRFGRPDESAPMVIHTTTAGVSLDLAVEYVLGEEEVFLHPWPRAIGKVQGAEALALTVDGTPIAVLDLQYFVRTSDDEIQASVQRSAPAPVLKVLLVDDSKITREMIRRILMDAELEVTSVASGESALGILKDGGIDCLVTDIEMPGIDGLELTRQVRRSADWEHLPVVVVSTRDQASDRMAGLDAGADAYLAKQNLDGRELVALIRRLGGHR